MAPADATQDLDLPTLQDRWVRAQARWEERFKQGPIPMVRKTQGLEADLVTIETLLYDQETRKVAPARCACGCNYVIGCLGDKSF